MEYKLPPLPESEAFESWMKGDATISLEKDGHGYVDMTAELMWHAWKARAAIEAQGVPDGWQLVPKEPTDKMIRAVCNCNDIDHREQIIADYAAALASAPPAPQAEELVQWKARALQAEAIVAKFMEPQASVVQQEPVAWMVEGWDGAKRVAKCLHHTIGDAKEYAAEFARHYPTIQTFPLYTHPAPQAKPQPLSDAKALASLLGAALGALRYHTEQTRPIERTNEVIRAIEHELAAHGIQGS